jgi:hypothetical protein
MTIEQQNEAFTGLVASAFVHFKKIIQGDPMQTYIPPTPSESKEAYLHDPIINRCVDAVVYGALTIYKQ